jgi:hypothetical protein
MNELHDKLNAEGIKTYMDMHRLNLLHSFEDITTTINRLDVAEIDDENLVVYLKCKIMQNLRNRIKEIQETMI